MKYSFITWLGSATLQVYTVFGYSPLDHNCVAHTDDRSFGGHHSTHKATVCEWLGVPYAQPPVGDLRFGPPVKPVLLNDAFEASSYGYDCPQNPSRYIAYPNATSQYAGIYANFVNSLNNTQSEDCLTLNIWSKPTQNFSNCVDGNSGLKPVLVWIYGGRFSAGSSNTPFYQGELLADAQDVVVVTFNFRMNIFGFPGAPELDIKNLALLDQRLAVSWVQDNIAVFGGDPSRITIAGQSSGSWAVSNWAYAFQDDPIVAGLISHSGNIFSFDSNNADLAASNWYNVSRTLGCGASESTLQCMRSPNITIDSILAAAARVPTTGSVTRSLPAFQITEDNLTVFSRSEYVSRLAAGQLARLPHLQLQTDHESGFYRISASARGIVLPESNWTLFEQETFTCPLAADAHGRTKLNVTSYRARYMADWDNLRLFYQMEPPYDSGAYHGVDVNMVVGNAEGVSGIESSAQEERLKETMQKAWVAFATDPSDGLTSVMGWPKYQADSETLILLGYNTTSAVKHVNPTTYDFACQNLDLVF
ncbi:hypothetical protein N8I77_000924 [Diaporthe amygdali]|uniref:Carboxylic ester hydrolase n=1 Tax=Phomopsis amygdali TaxID=1214568 RepID=A0AAD9SPU7_PHOAM|nr:hypothetical protein N8I77_000924 [Diaporthe amygdali]